MPVPVESGNEILIPLFDVEAANKLFHITWSQNLATRNADYYLVTADNITTGTQVPCFIAAEYYKTSTSANPNHINRVGQLLPGEGCKLKVNNALQYGQKNAAGELRFVVYHDKERKPYQHRFIETAVGSATATKAQELAKSFGYGGIGDQVGNLAKNFVGDYLHTF
ncbi:hypothetical protein BJ165DRAFT_1548456 [Panaeolus papilionaceus]|nr:hypothetical protein BJ165DRAFT_1548456 [Panaeolus papilionaceus]